MNLRQQMNRHQHYLLGVVRVVGAVAPSVVVLPLHPLKDLLVILNHKKPICISKDEDIFFVGTVRTSLHLVGSNNGRRVSVVGDAPGLQLHVNGLGRVLKVKDTEAPLALQGRIQKLVELHNHLLLALRPEAVVLCEGRLRESHFYTGERQLITGDERIGFEGCFLSCGIRDVRAGRNQGLSR